MFPYSRRYLKNGFKGHFATIGLIGGHEACMNLLGKGLDTPAGSRLMQRTLNHLRELVVEFQEKNRQPVQSGSHSRRGHLLQAGEN